MEFLIILGIKRSTINIIEQNPSFVFDLTANKEECSRIISYLKLIGVKNIDSLILYKQDLFLKTKDEVSSLFNNFEIRNIVDKINKDITNIDLLFESE